MDMKLEDYFCKFKRYYDYDQNIKYNIISAVFFKLKNLYKPFSIYIGGVKYFYEKKDILEKYNVKLRLYYDNSLFYDDENNEARELIELLKKDKNFQLIKFKCNFALDISDNDNRPMEISPGGKGNIGVDRRDKHRHSGIFPFFVRFFPLFDFDDNDTNFVFISDIDYSDHKKDREYFEFTIKYFLGTMIDKDMDLFIYAPACYIPYWNKNLMSFTMNGGMVGGKYKFNKDLLLKFFYHLQRMKDEKTFSYKKDKYSTLVNLYFERYHARLKSNITTASKIKIEGFGINEKYVYGIDELFLTYYLFPYALKKDINIYMFKTNSAGKFKVLFDLMFNNILHDKIEFSKKTNKIYRRILEYVYLEKYEKDNIQEDIKNFLLYFTKYEHDYDGTSNRAELYKRFYFIMALLINSKHKKYLAIEDYHIKCFLDNDKYYTDKNNIIILNDDKKKEYIKIIDSFFDK